MGEAWYDGRERRSVGSWVLRRDAVERFLWKKDLVGIAKKIVSSANYYPITLWGRMGRSLGLMLDGMRRREMMDEQSVCLLQASSKAHVQQLRRVTGRSNYHAPLIVLV